MNDLMTPVPDNDPMMIAWQAYKLTPEYANTRKWAMSEEDVDGSLWAAFCEGWARNPVLPATSPAS